MKKILFLGAMILVAATQSAFSAPPDEVLGIYTGIASESTLDHETSKLNLEAKKVAVGMEVKADDTITFEVIDGGVTHLFTQSIIGKSAFTGRVISGTTVLIIKGKFTGKGRKLKAAFYYSQPYSWSEGKISAQKLPV